MLPIVIHRQFCFFFNDTATTEIYTLSLHDALPICVRPAQRRGQDERRREADAERDERPEAGVTQHAGDRKSTRLNSSHANISYAVFCLKKNKELLVPYVERVCIRVHGTQVLRRVRY